MKRPWSKKEFPVLAGWLAANEKPLALLVAASKRPRRYDPLVSRDGSVIRVFFPAVGQYREAARALTARAMLRMDEGKVDEAWEDLLACHRLARLAGQGPSLVEGLVAIAVDRVACGGDQGLLQHARLTPAQIARMRADLDKLPPLPKMVDKFNVAERFLYLDCVGIVIREGINSLVNSLTDLTGDGKPKSKSRDKGMLMSLIETVLRVAVDWDQVLRMGNAWYDRMADACGKPTRAERQAAADKIDDDIGKLIADAKDWKSLGLSLLTGPRKAISKWMGEVLGGLLSPAIAAAVRAEDRATMQFDVTRLAFALAAYHADRGTFPARLADLAPNYVAEVPKDIFNASELHYRQEGEGYLLYSVGPNGRDDGGKGVDDEEKAIVENADAHVWNGWDDLSVRVPAATAQKQ